MEVPLQFRGGGVGQKEHLWCFVSMTMIRRVPELVLPSLVSFGDLEEEEALSLNVNFLSP